MDLFQFAYVSILDALRAFYAGPFITLLFLFYLAWEWRKTGKSQHTIDNPVVIFGVQQSTLAWIMKMVMAYHLFLLVYFALLYGFWYMGIELYQWAVNDIPPKTNATLFLNQHVNVPVRLLATGMEKSTSLHIIEGGIEMPGSVGFFITVVEYFISLSYRFVFYILLWQIFHSLSIHNPFTLRNVKRLRLLGVSFIVYSAIHSCIRFFSSWYVKTNVAFETNSNLQFTYISHENIFIFISILLLAEAIRYGAQLKEDQDLTV